MAVAQHSSHAATGIAAAFGAVEGEHVDVPAREAEGRGDILSRALLEQTHHDDRTLGLAEPVYAVSKTHALLSMRDQCLGRGSVGAQFDGIDGAVRARKMVSIGACSSRCWSRYRQGGGRVRRCRRVAHRAG